MLIMAANLGGTLSLAEPKISAPRDGGNLCRCTGYVGIVNAIARAATELAAQR